MVSLTGNLFEFQQFALLSVPNCHLGESSCQVAFIVILYLLLFMRRTTATARPI
jgi:hypothetical protein